MSQNDPLTSMEQKAAMVVSLSPKTSRSRKRGSEDDEFLNEMRLSRELITHILGDHPKSSRDVWINYVAMSLREMPQERYPAIQKDINELLTVQTPRSTVLQPPAQRHRAAPNPSTQPYQQFLQYQEFLQQQQQQQFQPQHQRFPPQQF
jgi:hypothetical protein